jgi:hypothetical protein
MLTTKTTVLVFTLEGAVEFLTDSLTLAERDFLYGASTNDWQPASVSYIWRNPARPNDLVNTALMLNFRFLDEASRLRWMVGEPFEMYRENTE